MKVFISWSGERGKQLGEAIRDWLPSVLQSVDPYFSPADIERGSRWDSEIAQALKESNVGIIILTPDSLSSPWIMFEAGAIARSVEKTRVCPILFEVKRTEVIGPLASFQMAVEFTQEEMRKVLSTINNAQEKKLDDAALTKAFEKWWPDPEDKRGKNLGKDAIDRAYRKTT